MHEPTQNRFASALALALAALLYLWAVHAGRPIGPNRERSEAALTNGREAHRIEAPARRSALARSDAAG